ncbi:pdgfa associated protein 1b isoform X1 [Oryzias melastigma]|uniref:pdgfa associated protein 1b isoform X1 n=1 Tax=Oryzias melastigma TaxID=30732 RepID=UPI000CF7CBAF|nr:pdgfa associated protein 1b isoform X1 [Oryzias melastigma]
MPKGGRKGGHKGRMRTYTSPEEIDAQMKAEKERKKHEQEEGEDDEGAAKKDASEDKLPGSGSDDSDDDDSERKKTGVEGLIEIENPNRVAQKSKKVTQIELDEPRQLSRRERFVSANIQQELWFSLKNKLILPSKQYVITESPNSSNWNSSCNIVEYYCLKNLTVVVVHSFSLFFLYREEIEKQKAKERYMKMHLAGKTDQAKADLARLAIIRKQREEAAKKKDEEKKAKEAAVAAAAAARGMNSLSLK